MSTSRRLSTGTGRMTRRHGGRRRQTGTGSLTRRHGRRGSRTGRGNFGRLRRNGRLKYSLSLSSFTFTLPSFRAGNNDSIFGQLLGWTFRGLTLRPQFENVTKSCVDSIPITTSCECHSICIIVCRSCRSSCWHCGRRWRE